MNHRKIVILTGLITLVVVLLVWIYFPAQAIEIETSEYLSPNWSQQDISTNQIFLPLVFKNYTTPAPLWRFGVSRTRLALSEWDSNELASMRFGWYVDYGVSANPSTPYGMEYIPIVRIKQDKQDEDGNPIYYRDGPFYMEPYTYTFSPDESQIQSLAAIRPGMTWVIGNEMDRIDYPYSTGGVGGQDEMLPELYAEAYHNLRLIILSADPSAKIAFGSMVEFTDLRKKYLDRVWDYYLTKYGEEMPVDIWTIHLYVLSEVKDAGGAEIPPGLSETSGQIYTILDNKDFTKAWAQIVSLRTWMEANGQKDKPLFITEYGVLWPEWVWCGTYPDTSGCPFTPEEVRDSYMYPSFDAFLNQTSLEIGFPDDGYRLVQRWNWFSLDYDLGKCEDYNGKLYFNVDFGGSLFNSGLGPSGCSFPSQGINTLGTYWKQYVQNLPAGSNIPYLP